MADGLTILGVHAEPTADGIVIDGGPLGGGSVESCDDHRIAMSFAHSWPGGLRANQNQKLSQCGNIISGFVELARKAGLRLHEEQG